MPMQGLRSHMRERISKCRTPNLNPYGKWRRLPPFPCASSEAALVSHLSTVYFWHMSHPVPCVAVRQVPVFHVDADGQG